MGYSGVTFLLPCSSGGLNHDANIDTIPSTAMVNPSRNININENGRTKRGGTAIVYEFPGADVLVTEGGSSIITEGEVFLETQESTPTEARGIYDFQMRDGTQYIITALSNGYVYKNETDTIATDMSSTTFFDFEVFDNELYIVDGNTCPKKWTGSGNATDLSAIPSDWAGSNYPQWVVKHGYGNSERLWFGGCPDNPNKVYGSKNGDADDISDGNCFTLNIETGDGFGIIGAIEYGDRLIFFGKDNAYILNDTDADTSNWGYYDAPWMGGTANFRTVFKIQGNIGSMEESGDIYLIGASSDYGDYTITSLLNASFMNRWIKQYVKLSDISKAHAVYDPTLKAIFFFIVRQGFTAINTALVYFTERAANEAWIIHDNQSYASGYDASCAALVRASEGNYKIYTGDYVGRVWKLNHTAKNDNGNPFYAGFKTAIQNFDNPRIKKLFKRLWVICESKGAYDISMNWWVDGQAKTGGTVSMSDAGAVLGSFVLGTDVLGGKTLISSPVDLGDKGVRIQVELYDATADHDFMISQLMFDYKPLGAGPR